MSVHTNLDDAHVMIDGRFVSAKIERVVLAIKEYCPEIRVDWLPPEARKAGQAAFKIVHEAPDREYVIFHVAREEDFDERVLSKIIAGDQRLGAQRYSELEAWEEANKRVAHQKWLDQLEEAEDIAKHVLATRKGRYKVSNDLIIDDTKPFNVAHLDEQTGLPRKDMD